MNEGKLAEHQIGGQQKENEYLARIEALLAELVRETRNNKKGRIADVDSPWFSLADAARYCAYSAEYFRDLAKEYEIPRNYGPHKSKFKRFDLDNWMEDPNCFKKPRVGISRRRTGEFKIHSMMRLRNGMTSQKPMKSPTACKKAKTELARIMESRRKNALL